jgi:hypothetical protein
LGAQEKIANIAGAAGGVAPDDFAFADFCVAVMLHRLLSRVVCRFAPSVSTDMACQGAWIGDFFPFLVLKGCVVRMRRHAREDGWGGGEGGEGGAGRWLARLLCFDCIAGFV